MKIDDETVVQYLVHNASAKPFQHNDPMTTVEQKSNKDSTKENLGDVKYTEDIAAPVPIDVNSGDGFWPVPGLSNPEADEVLTGSDKLTVKSSFASYTDCNGETELFKEDLDLFTDKTVTACEVDKSIPCHKENPFCEVKDICVDEGVPSHKVTLSETDGNKDLHAYLPIEKDANGDLDALECPKNCLEDFVQADTKGDKFGDELSKDKVTPLVQELASQNLERESSSDDIADGMKPPSAVGSNDESMMACSNLSTVKKLESVKRSEEEAPPSPSSIIQELNGTTLIHDSRDKSEMDKGSPEKRVATDPSPSERSEYRELVNEFSYCRKVESGSITFSFNASAPESSDRGESSSTGNKEQHEGQNAHRPDEASNRRTDSCLGRHDFGESSFSVAGPVSGSITYSGPITYSGSLSLRSLSLRSDSSTTSARSFAFPILQSEWNSSPVRMTKSDRRRLGKHKGWRQRLLCCKF
ncbi:uncharacterized protein LOC115754469 isoform X2 [Rhodamnia argentea]|uniref:Uncharacterized protein LOC115754469 n=1 Tax=Rhodamnia argentea TaxID=178133 RepID=A0A8B8QQN3_9MYRT|nr:uncharacterized protein LOC115754469 isoform X2 [Rhodamnia argentea]XP_048135063.1 uncharacterized protein LOC115754469 isoform X2 [Rhodamnia argentea]XP_048135064.1 uncharacterized protein LOC115754469 isoform X2 [Rhodamnia argentea]